MSLVGQPPEIADEDEARMSPLQKKLFQAHAAESAKLVSQMKKVPPIIVTAIEQHHQRGEGANRLAELIGISEEFLRLAEKAKDDPSIKVFETLRAKAEKEFSEPIVDAFVRTFTEK
ncbi:MAG: hypothetical protein HY075_04320 [Deltaproteobacteria bacterium]|nr:hypothetical protein [Deltaproteobacteria bacterium]